MNLNIIGNGFDLYHGLPSKYYHYGCYLINTNPMLFEEICKMHNSKFGKSVGPSISHKYIYTVDDILWREFEKIIGEVKETIIVETYEDDLGLENNDPINLNMEKETTANQIKRSFSHWIKETVDQDVNYRIINDLICPLKEKYKFNNDDYFILFNYTHTLQKVYSVSNERIHYIHGECMDNFDDNLVVGHGNDIRIEKIRKKIKKLESEYKFHYTQEKLNRINEYKEFLRYLEYMRKDIESCKIKYQFFLRKVPGDINTIKIFGMSLSEIDIPYLKLLNDFWPNIKWKFSYYNDVSKDRIKNIIKESIGIDESKYTLFKFHNTSSSKIGNKIINEHGIELH